jgi:hypothetical protein
MKLLYHEIFDLFEKAPGKKEKIAILQKHKSYVLDSLLTGMFHPGVQFVFDREPKWFRKEIPTGMGYTTIDQEIHRAYIFEKNNPRLASTLTQKKKEEILIQILEALEPKEADIFLMMVLKKPKIKGLTYSIVSEAFPLLLPPPNKKE